MARLPEDLANAIERFAQGATLVRQAAHGADAGALSRPGKEGWSVRDVLVHLADAELVRATRIRIILAEEQPALFDFNEELWKRRGHYLWRSPEAAIALFDQLRYTTMEIVRQLDLKSWERAGIHPADGPLTIAELISRGAAHSEDHAAQIRELRG